MPDPVCVPESVLKAATRALHACAVAEFWADPVGGRDASVWRHYAAVAVEAAVKEMGLTVQRSTFNGAYADGRERLVSPRLPVERVKGEQE